MRTKAAIKSHPIHPMLIAFPITFYTAVPVCDIVGRLWDSPAWWSLGKHFALAGVISALVAAVPGVIDLLLAVPPRSSAKKRGFIHAGVNVTATALFAVIWWMRGPAETMPTWGLIIAELAGLGLISIGGWLGGTLVYRNLIGPEHRYAETGKWNEESVEAEGEDGVVVAREGELGVDHMKLVHVNGERVVLARTKEGYFAFADSCAHRGASLADGVLIEGKVQCLWHGSRYDVQTGAVERGPADESIKTYRVTVAGGEIRLLDVPRKPTRAPSRAEPPRRLKPGLGT